MELSSRDKLNSQESKNFIDQLFATLMSNFPNRWIDKEIDDGYKSNLAKSIQQRGLKLDDIKSGVDYVRTKWTTDEPPTVGQFINICSPAETKLANTYVPPKHPTDPNRLEKLRAIKARTFSESRWAQRG